jgi:hypothetical protein
VLVEAVRELRDREDVDEVEEQLDVRDLGRRVGPAENALHCL